MNEELLIELIEKKNYQCNYEKRKQLRNDIYQHASGDKGLLGELIRTTLPSEPDDILQYRVDTLQPLTSSYFTKIINSISVIKESSSFDVNIYDEELEEYVKDTNDYFFSDLFVRCLIDANAFIVVVDNKIKFYSSNEVLYFNKHSLFVAIDSENYRLYEKNNITEYYYDRKNKKITEYVFNTMYTDSDVYYFFQVKGDLIESVDNCNIYKSFISGIVPFFNDAILEYSEKKAGIKQHLFPLFWTATSDKCSDCSGEGTRTYQDETYANFTSTCHTCQGTGVKPSGMFSKITVKQDAFSEKMPIPPAGYVQKDFSSIEFLNLDIKQNIFDAFASLNMEFLFQVPLNQSGVAKDVDRREYYSFLSKLISLCVDILNNIYRAQSFWFYFNRELVYNLDEYNYVQVQDLINEYTPRLIQIKDIESILSNKIYDMNTKENKVKYINNNISDTDDKEIERLKIELDTLFNYTTEEKINLRKLNVISEQDLSISINIDKFIRTLYYDKKISINDDFNTNYNKLILIYNETKENQGTII